MQVKKGDRPDLAAYLLLGGVKKSDSVQSPESMRAALRSFAQNHNKAFRNKQKKINQ